VPSSLPDGDPAPSDGRLPESALSTLGRTPFGFYVHVPFCTTRCGYCDFNTYTAQELGEGSSAVSQGTYADTVIAEIRLAREVLPASTPPVSTVFVGGGTPTLLPADDLGLIVAEIDALFGIAPGAEITTEANPETVSQAYLEHLRAAGFTRLSLGMQSAAAHVLQVLDRVHTPGRATQAVAEARAAGFEHINLDLIYGSPKETDADWQLSLDTAIAAGPDHVSAYALIVEEGTALARQVARGIVPAPDDDVLADRYVQADETLRRAGFEWYEVSNWARTPAAQCAHNMLYWRNHNWWGAGPGAHSHIGGVRWWNAKHPASYAQRLAEALSPAAGRETLGADSRLMEHIMLAVRLREGIGTAELSAHGLVRAQEAVGRQLLDRGMWDLGRIVLTQRGRLLADAVVRDLVA
jgi:putative oxygen-independent coproporphyrinogen III oxidase